MATFNDDSLPLCRPRQSLEASGRRGGAWRLQAGCLLALLGLPLTAAHALSVLDEEELSGETGSGLAFALDDFSYRMAPTSYIELTGTTPSSAAASAGWKRGDLRYYGLSMTGSGAGTDWFGNGCSSGLGCPLGTGAIADFAPVYNPYVLRVFQYDGYNFSGTNLTGASRPTILELIGPSQADSWRWAFWGELEVDKGSASPGLLQSQTIIEGKPVTADGKPTVMQLMRTADTAANASLGIVYQSRLSGNFRFSVNQTSSSPNALHKVPDFSNDEGMYFRNVDAFLPMGQLHYQALTFNDLDTDPDGTGPLAAHDGNFTIELTAIPNIANVYNTFYCGSASGCATDANGFIASPNPATHGYVRWGNFNMNISGTDTTNGIYFQSSAATPVVTNLGTSKIENMLIHHLKITTLGAGVP